MDGIQDVIFLKDTAARYVMLNEAHERVLGIADEEVLGHTVLETTMPKPSQSSHRPPSTLKLKVPGVYLR